MKRSEIVEAMARAMRHVGPNFVHDYQHAAEAEAALTALEARGLAVVPKEATLKMQNAAVDATGLHYTAPDHTGWRRSPQMLFEAGWTAMLTASQKGNADE